MDPVGYLMGQALGTIQPAQSLPGYDAVAAQYPGWSNADIYTYLQNQQNAAPASTPTSTPLPQVQSPTPSVNMNNVSQGSAPAPQNPSAAAAPSVPTGFPYQSPATQSYSSVGSSKPGTQGGGLQPAMGSMPQNMGGMPSNMQQPPQTPPQGKPGTSGGGLPQQNMITSVPNVQLSSPAAAALGGSTGGASK